jgi:hypothetical protein
MTDSNYKGGDVLARLIFTKARLLAAEFQKRYSAFIMQYQAGRIGKAPQAYMCREFGLEVEGGLRIEVGLEKISDEDVPPAGCQNLPESEYVGKHGEIPVRYILH